MSAVVSTSESKEVSTKMKIPVLSLFLCLSLCKAGGGITLCTVVVLLVSINY